MARLGLSVDEMLSVQNTWKLVMENVGHTAENMVLMWFEKEPQVVNLFPRFVGKSMDELRLIPRVRSHGTHIFCAMDGIIRNLHKDEVVEELLADLRRDHIHVKNTISEEEFQRFTVILGEFLEKKLGAMYTSMTSGAYLKLLPALGREGGIHK